MKQIISIFLTLILLVAPLPMAQANENLNENYNENLANEVKDVLVIYDQLAIGTAYSDNLSAVEALLSALSQTIEVVPMAAYQPGRIQKYAKVILLKNTENPIENEALKADLLNVTGEMLYIGYLTPGLMPKLGSVDIIRQMGQTVTLSLGQLTIASIWLDQVRVINQQPNQQPNDNQTAIAVGGTTYPFSQTIDNITVVPTFTGNNGFRIGLGGLLKNWLAPAASTDMVVLIPEIYPFSDLDMVIKISDEFYANGIPFALGVAPIDNNSDYPAMERFYQVLRYAQSKNGSILIHRPSPETLADSETALSEKMVRMLDTMVAKGVYPLGLVTPEALFFQDHNTVSPLNSFSSAIILADQLDQPEQNPADTGMKNTWALDQASLAIDFATVKNTGSQIRQFGSYPISTAIILPLPPDEASLDAIIATINSKWLSLTDYKQLNNQWAIGQNSITSGAGNITVNGAPISLTFNEAPIDEDFAYQKPPDYSLEKIFNLGNAFLLIVVGIIIILFTIIVVFSRRVYLNKFRKKVKIDEKANKKIIEEKDLENNRKDEEKITP